MATSQDLKSLLNKYYTFRNNTDALAAKVFSCLQSNNLDTASNNIKNAYLINDSSADDGKIDSVREQINELYSNLVNVTIPAIDEKISQLNNQISEAADAEVAKSLSQATRSRSSRASGGGTRNRGGRV